MPTALFHTYDRQWAARAALAESGIAIIRPNITPDIARRLRRARALARLLDSQFRIPGTSITFGVDGIAGLIPGVGDGATLLVSCVIIYDAWRSGVPESTLARMLFNVGLDALIGLTPLLGDVFDIWFKANRRNLALFEAAFEGAI